MDEKPVIEPLKKNVTIAEFEAAQLARLWVRGMGCATCAVQVRNSLLCLPGALQACVDHRTGSAEVCYDPRRTATSELIEAVARAGGDSRHMYRAELAGYLG